MDQHREKFMNRIYKVPDNAKEPLLSGRSDYNQNQQVNIRYDKQDPISHGMKEFFCNPWYALLSFISMLLFIYVIFILIVYK